MRYSNFSTLKSVKFFLSIFTLTLLSCSSGTNGSNQPQLVFVTQPGNSSTPSGTNNYISPTIEIKVLSANGKAESTASVPVTLAIANQPNANLPHGNIYAGYLTGTTTVNSINGIVRFESLSVSQPGSGYTLIATASGYNQAVSNSFNVNSSIAIAESAGYKETADNKGYEVAYLGEIGVNYQGNVYVYVDYGSNPITTDSEFNNFNCGESWIRNTPRHATFDYANTIGSPMAAPGLLLPYTDCQGHTWGLIVISISYSWPFESSAYPTPQPVSGWQAAQTSNFVPPGEVKYSSINKNQLYLFTKVDSIGNPVVRHFVEDQWGNIYIMKSTNLVYITESQISQAFESAVFPTGWSKFSGTLAQDLYSMPAYNDYGNESYPSALYMDLRDNADNGYSLIYWSGKGNSLAQQALPTGVLPLVITEAGGQLNGTESDDQMWGSSGNDIFYPYLGNDSINGGDGINTVALNMTSTVCAIITTNEVTVVSCPTEIKTLTNIKWLQFSDQKISLQ